MRARQITPLVEIGSDSSTARIFAKLECNNPTGSLKDRVIEYFFNNLRHGGRASTSIDEFVEASSGNTGASVAYFAKKLGAKATIFVPETTSVEKLQLIYILGGMVIKVGKNKPFMGAEDYYEAAKLYKGDSARIVFVDQYNSPFNADAHYNELGKEIVTQIAGQVDYFVSVASTGGTISGVGRRIKECFPKAKIVLADPYGSIYYPTFYGKENTHLHRKIEIEGAGKKSVTRNMDFSVIDSVVRFSREDAIKTAISLLQDEKIFAGVTSGANVLVSKKIARRARRKVNIVTILPDTGFKYLSLFSAFEKLMPDSADCL